MNILLIPKQDHIDELSPEGNYMKLILCPSFLWLRTLGVILCLIFMIIPMIGCINDMTTTPLEVSEKTNILVSVNTNQSQGQLPYLFRAGMFTFSALIPDYIQQKLFKDLKPGSIEIDLGHSLLRVSKDMKDILLVLSWLDPFLLKLKEHGGEVVIGFSKYPRWLSSRPNDDTPVIPGVDETPIAVLSPPRDYEEWAKLVENIATHMKRLGIDVRYKIGWEPEWMWQGTEEEFFKFYRYAILGVRRADPHACIGGPGVSDPPFGQFRKHTSGTEPMLRSFIKYCSSNGIPELGISRLPIDFIAVHRFGGSPLTTYPLIVEPIKKWLKEFGYDPETELYIGEWSDKPDAFSPDRENPYIASFIIANLVSMDSAGIDRHSFTSLLEQQVKEETQFNGGFGLFTKDFITRPSFHAFKALSELGETRLKLLSSDPWVFGVAGKDQNRIAVVVANYIPTHRILLRTFIERLFLKGYRPSDLILYFKNSKMLDLVFRGEKDPSHFKVPVQMETDILAIRSDLHSLAKHLKERAKTKIKINIEFKEFSWPDPFVYKEYRIDSKHSTPFRIQEEIDRVIIEQKRGILGNLNEEIDSILSKQGYSMKEIKDFRAFMKYSKKRTLIDKLSRQERNQFLKMNRYLVTEKEKRLASISEEINMRSDVQFQQIQEKLISETNDPSFTLELEPNSVSLIILEKRNPVSVDILINNREEVN